VVASPGEITGGKKVIAKSFKRPDIKPVLKCLIKIQKEPGGITAVK
jgi:hypothetical protein